RAAAADVRGRREQSRPRRQQGRRREPKLPMKPVSSVAHTPPAPLVPACSIRKITALMSNPALVLASLLIGGSLPGILHGQAPDSSKGGGVLTPGDSGGHTEVRLDLTRLESGAAKMSIRSGDQILVERRRSIFSQVILPAVTVIGALASVGIFIHQYR